MRDSELTEKQLAKIDQYLKDEGKLNRAVANTLTDKRTSGRARQYALGNIAALRAGIVDKLNGLRLRDQIREAVCTGYDWCNKRGQRGYNVMINLVRLVMTAIGGVAGLSIAIIIFMIKHYLFDTLCNCPPPAKVI